MDKMDLSVIIPVYNEENNISKLHSQLTSVLSKVNLASEIVYINDGSTDGSKKVLGKLLDSRNSNIRTKVIELKRNFGQTAAVSAGIENSKGDLISFLDADLQNDPEDIPRFLEKINEGYDAVFGWRKKRKDATLRSLLSRIANRIISFIFSYPFNDVGCSSRVVKREYLEDIQLYGELHRIMPVLIYLKGAKVGEIIVKHHERYKGKSKYGFERIVKTIIDLITVKFLSSYGTRPAYVFSTIGLGSMVVATVMLVIVAYRKIFSGIFVHRNPLFLVTIFLGLLGVQFIMMGLLAELQMRTYFESQKKLIYEIKRIYSN